MNNYTTVYHKGRIELGLTNNEYCIADIICKLSSNPEGTGWCYASKQKMSGFIGISRQSVIKIIKKLEFLKLVERNQETNHLKTTKKWYDTIIIGCKESLRGVNKVNTFSKKTVQDSVKKVNENRKESLHNNNNIAILNNNIYNSIFDHWNSLEIVVHKNLSPVAKKAIHKILKDHTDIELKDAMNKYKTVISDQSYYFNYTWGLENFLKRKGGFKDFLSSGEKWLNYKKDANRFNDGRSGENIIKDLDYKSTTEEVVE